MGREKEIENIHERFSSTPDDSANQRPKTKICVLRGPGGIGKSQIAFFFEYTHAHEYQRIIFIDCENTDSFINSVKEVIREYQLEIPTDNNACYSLMQSLLTAEKRYLLIIDNVDTEELFDLMRKIYPTHSSGDVLITARYASAAMSAHTIPVKGLDLSNGIRLFKEVLNKQYHPAFDRHSDQEKKEFIEEDLDGFPLAIRIAAMNFNTHNAAQKPASYQTIKQYRGHLRKLEIGTKFFYADFLPNSDELDYTRTILAAYIPNIKQIAEKFGAQKEKYESLLKDFLHFFAFFGTMQNIPFSIEEIRKLFRQLTLYSDIPDVGFDTVIALLEKHSLIERKFISEHQLFISIPQTVKWAAQYHFLQEVEDRFQNRSEHAYDQGRYFWFQKSAEYFNDLVNEDNILDEIQMTIFFSFLEFLQQTQCPEQIKIEFINNSKIFNTMTDGILQDTQQIRNIMNTLPSELIDQFLDGLEKSIKSTKDSNKKTKIGQSLINLGTLYSESNPGKAKRFFETAIDAGNESGMFSLGMLYLNVFDNKKDTSDMGNILNQLGCKDRNELLNQAIKYFTKQIDSNKSDKATAFNNIGVCFNRLNDREGAKSNYREAIRINPYNPLFHSNLSTNLDDPSDKEKHKRIAEGLKKALPALNKIPDKYKKAILDFLSSESNFKLNIPEEKGLINTEFGCIFGDILNSNSTITTLDLSEYPFDNDGMRHLAKSLATNQTIKELRIQWSESLSYTTIKEFYFNLKENKSITQLSLSNSERLSSEAILELFENAPPQLKIIELKDFENTPEGKKHKENLSQSLINLGKNYKESDPIIAKRCFKTAISFGHSTGYFELDLLYGLLSQKEKKPEKQKKLVSKALECCDKQIAINPCAEAYNNRGYRFEQLQQPRQAMFNYNKAKEIDPYEYLYYNNLSRIHSTLNNQIESQRYKRIAEGLRKAPQNFKALPKGYKEMILDFLSRETSFELKESSAKHTMDQDHGIIFGKMINDNPAIKSLRLYGCDLNDEGVQSIATSLETNEWIEELQLEWNSLLTPVGVNALTDRLKKNKTLKKLSLAECSQVTSASIINLIEKAPPQLKTIEVSEYWNITDKKKTILEKAKKKNITIIFHPLSWSRYLW